MCQTDHTVRSGGSDQLVLIDDRTGSKELERYLGRSVPRVLTRLQFADVAWVGDNGELVGVERKTISDLCSCIADGRLSGHQLLGMLNEYHRIYILVEGVWRSNGNNGVLEVYKGGKWIPLELGRRRFMYREVANFLNTLAIMCRVNVWQTSNMVESGQWISNTYWWWQKEWERHKAHLQFRVDMEYGESVSLSKPNLVCRMAKELSGVGWSKARELGKRYGNAMELVMAQEKDLMEVAGIGKKLARSIIKELSDGSGTAR